MSGKVKITRESLYDDVWRMPMFEVGEKYGLSRPTIKWACQELCVPLPPQAYWTHLRKGLVIATAPPLPPRAPRQKIDWKELKQREPKKRKRLPSEARKEAERRRQLLYAEAADHEGLLVEADNWQHAELIRRYLAELDGRLAAGGLPVEGYEKWRAMAERYIADLCPLDSRVISPFLE